MGLLKKIGQIFLRGVEIYTGISSSGLIPPGSVVSKDLEAIAVVIQQIEVMGQALSIAGPQKLIAAAPLVAQIILQSSLLRDHKIENIELFTSGSKKIADGMADILNSLHPDITTISKT